MAHAPAVPTGTAPLEQSFTEVAEFYAAKLAETPALTADDLIPLTSGFDGSMPERTANRQMLHNEKDIVSLSGLAGGDYALEVYLPPSDAKFKMFWDAWKNDETLIYNFFYKSGEGQAGYLKVRSIQPGTDPSAIYSHTLNISTFNVNLIDAPTGTGG